MPQARQSGRIVALGVVLALAFPAALGAPGRAGRFYDDAAARLERNDAAGAIIQLKNALQQDPKLLAAYILLGRAYLVEDHPAAAEDAFTKALQLGVNRAEIAVPMARALLAQGKYQQVLERFPLETAPTGGRGELALMRGQAYQGTGNVEAARRAYEEARAVDPKATAPILALAELTARQGRHAEAVRLAEQAMALGPGIAGVWHFKGGLALGAGDARTALDAFGKALAIDPNHVEARVARTALLMDLGRLDEAGKDTEHLAASNPHAPRGLYIRAVYAAKRGNDRGAKDALTAMTQAIDPVPRDVLKTRAPDLLLLAGLGYQGLGQREKARQFLDDYIAVRPRDVGARRLLASILIGQRDFRLAISLLEPARKEAPNDPQVLALLGTAHMGLRQHNLAENYLEQALKESGGAADVHASFGLSLLGSGQGDLALQHLEQAFKKDPGAARSGIALTILNMRRGEPQEAVRIAEAVVKRTPGDANALNLLGVARQATGDLKGARSAYQHAVAAEAAFTPALLNLGKLDVAEGQYAAARTRFEAVLKRQPSNAQAMYELALGEQAAGRTAEAIRWLEKARVANRRFVAAGIRLVDLHLANKAPDKALEVAKELDAGSPDNLEALAALGRVALALGNTRQAQTVFGRMARLAGFNPVWQTQIARYQAAANNLQGAAYSVEKALSGQPDYLPAQALLAELDLRNGDTAKAEQRAKALIARAPDKALGYRLLAEIAMVRKNYPEAIERYRTALAKEPGTEAALRVFGAQLQSGDAKGATQFLETWVRNHPGDAFASRALAEGYVRSGNLAAARARYEQLLKEHGDDAPLLNNLASILLLQGDRQAVDYAARAFQLAPTDAAIQDTLGWALVEQGELDQGLRHLRDARLRDPSSAEIRYHLAAALARAGRKAEARKELEPVVKEDVRFASRDSAKALWRNISAE